MNTTINQQLFRGNCYPAVAPGGCNWCWKINTDDRKTSVLGRHENTQTAQDSDCAVFLKWARIDGCKWKLNSVLAIIGDHVLCSLFNRVFWVVALSLMVEVWSWLFCCFRISQQYANYAHFLFIKELHVIFLSTYGWKTNLMSTVHETS